VADDIDRRVRLEMAQQRVEVGDVIREPVTIVVPLRQTEATPVRRDHEPIVLERIHRELERRRHVHPAVQEEKFRRGFAAPGAHVVAQAADVDKLRLALFHEDQMLLSRQDAKSAKEVR